jgi:hypothetical protein
MKNEPERTPSEVRAEGRIHPSSFVLQPFPDALMLPAALKRGARLHDRVASIAAIAEPLLGVDRAAGERAWVRQQPHGRLFVTRDPADTIFFPRDHDRQGQPRYRWETQADGSQWGWLISE